jgi:hypothetical protein
MEKTVINLQYKALLQICIFVLMLCLPYTKVDAFVGPGMTAEGTLTHGTNLVNQLQFGDINGDRKVDLVEFFPSYSSNTGRILVYFGNGIQFSPTPDITITGTVPSVGYVGGIDFGNGFAIADLNADGFDDILIDSPANNEGGNLSGKIYVFYGSSTFSGDKLTSQANLSANGNTTNNKFYGSAISIFDANNDGKNDIVVLAPSSNYDTTSNIYTFLNSNNTFDFANPSFTLSTTGTKLYIFSSMKIGDFDGDGNRDIFIGDYTSGFSDDKMYLLRGLGTGAFVQTSVYNPELSTDSFGRHSSVSTADINDDGKSDFCAGAFGNDTVSTNQGRVYCFFGRTTFNSSYSVTEADVILNGLASNDDFGRVTYLYDVTNDGKPDLLVGAYQTDAAAGSRHGRFFIYKNSGGTLSNAPWFSEIKTSGNTLYGASVGAIDYDFDGWVNIMVRQVGSTGGGTGDNILNYFEISHGSPSITLNVTIPTKDRIVYGTAIDTNSDYNISGVEWSTSSNTSGIWTDCMATDGAFDSGHEPYSCDISSIANGSEKTIFVRSHDQNDLYIPPQLYANNAHSPVSSSRDEEHYQIPEVSGSNIISGAFTPYKDSNTGGQQVTTVIEPHTFPFNAFLSSNTTTPSMLASLVSPSSSPGSSSNMILTGGSVMGIRHADGAVSWQVGNIQEIWYKAYPPRNSDKQPVNILPALQSKPSIISLSYTQKDLIPPGDSTHPFSPKSLKLAYSSDGKVWSIIPSSVVDISNKTVAAIHKLGGYYMIASSAGLSAGALTKEEQFTLSKVEGKEDVRGVTTNIMDSITPIPTPEPTIQPMNSPIPHPESRFCVLGWCW